MTSQSPQADLCKEPDITKAPSESNPCPVPLLVAIVNYRTADLSISALRSLLTELPTLPGMQAVVVDNDSGDGSVEKIAQAIESEGWGSWASVVPAEKNGGFAYGNNAAIRPAFQSDTPPPYYMLLNSDAEARPGSMKALVDFMDANPKAGIAGSCIEKFDGELWPIAFRFPSILSELDSGLRLGFVSKLLSRWVVAQTMATDRPQQIDWMPGACMIIRREVFESVGLMDDHYFLYYEETDFCLQAKRAGWECWYVPESKVMHLAGQSTGVTGRDRAQKRIPQYVWDSRRRYFVKNHGVFYAALADVAWSTGFSLWNLRRMVQRKPDTDPPQMFEDFLRNTVFAKGFRDIQV